MSRINFDINKENYITASGSLVGVKKRLSLPDLSNCIRLSIDLYKEIEESYIKGMSNDNKIVGIERSDILEDIDYFINSLILMWVLVSNDHDDQQIINIDDRMSNTHINITVNNDMWNGSGLVSELLMKPSKNFREAYNNKLSPAFSKFLSGYKKAAEDNVLTDNERLALESEINDIIYTAIYLRFQISHCIVDS